MAAALLAACATPPHVPPADPLISLLQPGESIAFRAPAQLLHGHDMEEPAYDRSEGYRPIPAYRGELAVTSQRLLFTVRPAGAQPAWVSIPFAEIARARPSRTPLLNYIVVWDRDQHPDAFQVSAGDVAELHRQVGLALMRRPAAAADAAAHTLPAAD